MTYLVAGLDGSLASKAALRFAAEEARLREAELRVVSAWEVPGSAYPAMYYLPTLDPEDVAQYARETAEQAVEEVLGDQMLDSIKLVVREGSAPYVLLEEASQAVMLVVGSRGRGGFAGLLLGSVSQHCASHARCPVTIVREVVAER